MKEIFTLEPKTLLLYSFRNEQDLYESQALKKHYNKLLGAVDKVIANIDNLKSVEHTLRALGEMHVKYGVIKSHYSLVGRALLNTMEIGLADNYNDLIKEAWTRFYGQISQVMISDHYSEFMNIEKQIQLSDDKKFCVFISWQLAKDFGVTKVGKILMRNIFSIEPKTLQLYSFRNAKDLYESKELKQHSLKLVGALNAVIDSMKD